MTTTPHCTECDNHEEDLSDLTEQQRKSIAHQVAVSAAGYRLQNRIFERYRD